jgi:hypothetical protein
MRTAVIDLSTGLVVNVIVANATVDIPHDGYRFVDIPDLELVDINWTWSEQSGFINPNQVNVIVDAVNKKAIVGDRIPIQRLDSESGAV